jgi:hypothetical protein
VDGWEGRVFGQLGKVFDWLIQHFVSAEGQPEVWLKIRHRQPDGWRVLDLMIDNKLEAALQVKDVPFQRQ